MATVSFIFSLYIPLVCLRRVENQHSLLFVRISLEAS